MPLAVVGYAPFGSSRHLFVGPSATVATLPASSLAVVATAATGSAEYVALARALTLMAGEIYVAGGLARMGFVARFLARPVLEGFTRRARPLRRDRPAAEAVGIDKPSGNTLSLLANTIADVTSREWTTVAVGVTGLVALFALARFAAKLPGVIIVVVIAVRGRGARPAGPRSGGPGPPARAGARPRVRAQRSRGREEHPVVHVAYEDAERYAAGAGGRLPTEAEWELEARGDLEGAAYTWGDEPEPAGERLANHCSSANSAASCRAPRWSAEHRERAARGGSRSWRSRAAKQPTLTLLVQRCDLGPG